MQRWRERPHGGGRENHAKVERKDHYWVEKNVLGVKAHLVARFEECFMRFKLTFG